MQSRTLDKKLNRFRTKQGVDARVAIGCREGKNVIGLLSADVQPFAARGEEAGLGRAAKQRIDDPRARGYQMLTIVENEQQLAVLEVLA